MFDKEYVFKGTHAEKVIQLTAKFDDKNQIFNRNYDVYLMAPIVGLLYNRTAEISSNESNAKTTKVFPDILIKNQDELAFNYRLIMMLDKKRTPELEDRIEKAFRNYNSERAAEDEKIYNSYVLGGVDVLYEKLIESARTPEDYMSNLYDFLDEIDERYNQTIDSEHISELCKLARK